MGGNASEHLEGLYFYVGVVVTLLVVIYKPENTVGDSERPCKAYQELPAFRCTIRPHSHRGVGYSRAVETCRTGLFTCHCLATHRIWPPGATDHHTFSNNCTTITASIRKNSIRSGAATHSISLPRVGERQTGSCGLTRKASLICDSVGKSPCFAAVLNCMFK